MEQTKMLVWNDPATNKNKFYEITLSGEHVSVRYGRVGDAGKTVNYGPIGEIGFNRKVREKTRKGYRETRVVSQNGIKPASAELHRAATTTLVGANNDPRLTALVQRLVRVNAHEILKASGGKLKVEDGQITTPLGLLTIDAIADARRILEEIEKRPKTRKQHLSDYMTLVPQNVGRGRDWVESFLATPEQIIEQKDFLNQLKESILFSEKASVSAGEEQNYDDLFKYRITPVDDKKIIQKLERRFKASSSRNHSHRLQQAKLVNVYSFRDAAADEMFEARAKELGNLIEGWHGTRAMNLLSIASRGLLTPRRDSGLYTTGAMFGQGIYSSTVSTKALGYSDSGIWASSSSDTHYLFDVNVCLGWEYRPGMSTPAIADWNKILDGKITDAKRPHRTYNSINVRAGYAYGGYSKLLNPETIVPNADQLQIRYLLEFKS